MTGKARLAGISLLVSLLGGQVFAQGAAAPTPGSLGDLAARFGARQFIRSMSLSPDGQRVAIIESRADGTELVATADLNAGGPPKGIMASPSKTAHITRCSWPTDTRLICYVREAIVEADRVKAFSRMFALNADGSDLKLLSTGTNDRSLYSLQFGGEVIDQVGKGNKPGSVLITREFVPEEAVGTHISSNAEGLAVEQVNISSLSHSTVEQPRRAAAAYMTDGLGMVRLRADNPQDVVGYAETYVDWFYRKPDSNDWFPLGRVTTKGGVEEGFRPVAVDPALNVAYGFDAQNGFDALYRIKLDGSNERELVAAQPSVDVNGVLTIGRQQRVVGAAYSTDRRGSEVFDPELKALAAALGRALPENPDIAFVDASTDENKLLLLTTSDTNPGMFYRFDKKTKNLEEVLRVRPELAKTQLAPMRAVTFTARDGSQVPAYLTLPLGGADKGLPAIVLPHGGPSARDEWGFDWLVQFFAARGFAVIQPNFRGSAGYGAAWFEKNGFQSWQSAISDVDDAGKWLVKEGIADPSKLAIVGWSYGGYAALQSGVYEPGLFKAIVAVAPVTDLASLVSARQHFMDYNLVRDMIGDGPHIRQGSPAQNAARITAPVLMFQGTLDENVPVQQSQFMQEQLRAANKPVDYVEFAGLDHQLDDASARATLLARTDAFLRQSMGMPALP